MLRPWDTHIEARSNDGTFYVHIYKSTISAPKLGDPSISNWCVNERPCKEFARNAQNAALLTDLSSRLHTCRVGNKRFVIDLIRDHFERSYDSFPSKAGGSAPRDLAKL
jgi:hypothetical protein